MRQNEVFQKNLQLDYFLTAGGPDVIHIDAKILKFD